MLNIDDKELFYLLETKRKTIERPKHDGLGEIIASISLMVTLVLSDYNNLVFKPLYFQIIVWGIAIVTLLLGVYSLLKGSTNPYTIEKLYSEIADLDPKVEHPFCAAIIRSSFPEGKYLVYYNKIWKCWIFPNYYSSDDGVDINNELARVAANIKRDLSWNLSFKYLGDKVSRKYSYSNNMMIKYHFYFFEAEEPSKIHKKAFTSNGKKYSWKTLDQLYSHSKTRKRNGDVLTYIKNRCDVS